MIAQDSTKHNFREIKVFPWLSSSQLFESVHHLTMDFLASILNEFNSQFDDFAAILGVVKLNIH